MRARARALLKIISVTIIGMGFMLSHLIHIVMKRKIWNGFRSKPKKCEVIEFLRLKNQILTGTRECKRIFNQIRDADALSIILDDHDWFLSSSGPPINV